MRARATVFVDFILFCFLRIWMEYKFLLWILLFCWCIQEYACVFGERNARKNRNSPHRCFHSSLIRFGEIDTQQITINRKRRKGTTRRKNVTGNNHGLREWTAKLKTTAIYHAFASLIRFFDFNEIPVPFGGDYMRISVYPWQKRRLETHNRIFVKTKSRHSKIQQQHLCAFK